MSMFEQASRLKLRFESPKGLLSVEDLWDIPLTSNTGKANLDDVARALYTELRESSQAVSFVNPSEKSNDILQLKFDVAKHIIDVRVAERNAAKELEERKQKKQHLLEIISRKENAVLEGQSLEELRKMAEAL